MKKYLDVLKQAAKDWSLDNCLRLGASLAYYTMTSLFPLLLIVTAVAGYILTRTGQGNNVQEQMIGAINRSVQNPQLAKALQDGLKGAADNAADKSVFSSVIGFVLLLFAASGVFGELDSAFNIIWNVPSEAQGKGVMNFIKTKFLSFTLVLGVAFLLLVSTVLSTVLGAISDRLPLGPLWTVVNYIVQIGVIALVFALLFKYLPDTNVEWRDVWTGAIFTALLWVVGQLLLSFYFASIDGSSAYGVIGSVLAFLIYIYYSSQILFFGGEVTQAYANLHGSKQPEPTPDKVGVISKPAAVMVTTAYTAGHATTAEEIAALKTQRYAAAATGGIIGLLGGALIGGVGLVIGIGKGVGKIRKR